MRSGSYRFEGGKGGQSVTSRQPPYKTATDRGLHNKPNILLIFESVARGDGYRLADRPARSSGLRDVALAGYEARGAGRDLGSAQSASRGCDTSL